MVKHTQTIVGNLPPNCLSMFDRFVGLVLKGLSSNRTMILTKHNGNGLFENVLLSEILNFLGLVANFIKGSNQSTWTISSGIITNMVQTASSSRWYTNWWFIIDIWVRWWRTYHETGKLYFVFSVRSFLLMVFCAMRKFLAVKKKKKNRNKKSWIAKWRSKISFSINLLSLVFLHEVKCPF